jgi:hypothetical protein
MHRSTIAVFFGALALSGCKDSVACERARLNVHHAWDALKQEATRNKVKAADERWDSQVKAWTQIETKLEVLESAFATEQVTWDSANKKVEELRRATGEASTSGPGAGIQGFVAQMDEAARSQSAMEKKCR